MKATDAIRIGKVTDGGSEAVVVELFGVTVAISHRMVEQFDTEPDFVRFWSDYFMARFVEQMIEQVQSRRGVQGWALNTVLSPPMPKLPREGEEE